MDSFVEIESVVSTDGKFISLALSYGNPIISRENAVIIDTFISITSDKVNKNLLSKRYGIRRTSLISNQLNNQKTPL